MKVQAIQPSFKGYILLDEKISNKLNRQEHHVIDLLREDIMDAPYNIFVRNDGENDYNVLVRNVNTGMSARLYFNTLQDKIPHTIHNIINLANIKK